MISRGTLSPLHHEAKVEELENAEELTGKDAKKLENYQNNKPVFDAIVAAFEAAVGDTVYMEEQDFLPVLTKVLAQATSDKKLIAKIAAVLSEMDKNAEIQRDKKGNVIFDKETKDTEVVKFKEDIDTYMAREVLPHIPDAVAFFEENLGAKKPVIKTGAEIPFTRYFYKMGNGTGVTAGAGNPAFEDKYSVSYMWEEILTKDTILNLLSKFVFVESRKKVDEKIGKIKRSETLIFPRYHQLDVIRKLMADVHENRTAQNYLIQHSAGSGKTNSIAWLAHRLTSLHDADNKIIFDNVIIITDRVVVDCQPQKAIMGMEHKAGLIRVMDDKCNSADLAIALNRNKKIMATSGLQLLSMKPILPPQARIWRQLQWPSALGSRLKKMSRI